MGMKGQGNSFANLGLESFFLYAKRIPPCRQAHQLIFARFVGAPVPFQSCAYVLDRNLGSGNNSFPLVSVTVPNRVPSCV